MRERRTIQALHSAVLAVVLLLIGSGPMTAAQEPMRGRIKVLVEFRIGGDVPPADASRCCEILKDHVSRAGNAVVVDSARFDQLLREVEKARPTLSPQELRRTVCAMMGVDMLYGGSIKKAGGAFQISLEVVDLPSRRHESQRATVSDSTELAGCMEKLAKRIVCWRLQRNIGGIWVCQDVRRGRAERPSGFALIQQAGKDVTLRFVRDGEALSGTYQHGKLKLLAATTKAGRRCLAGQLSKDRASLPCTLEQRAESGRSSRRMVLLTPAETMLWSDPNNLWLLNNLAWLYVSQPDYRNPDEAVRLAERLVRMHPEHADFQDTLALAYAEKGDFDAAVKSADRAISLKDDTHYRDHLDAFTKKMTWLEHATGPDRQPKATEQVKSAQEGEKTPDIEEQTERRTEIERKKAEFERHCRVLLDFRMDRCRSSIECLRDRCWEGKVGAEPSHEQHVKRALRQEWEQVVREWGNLCDRYGHDPDIDPVFGSKRQEVEQLADQVTSWLK